MKVLAFIRCSRGLETCGAGARLAPGFVLHPSEDGEALSTNAPEVLPQAGTGWHEAQSGAAAPSFWFAVYTSSRHEKRVAQHLTQRSIEHFLPLYRTQHKWRDGSRVMLDLPLFPGYLFVRIGRRERARVLSVPGALAVVGGTGGEPAAVPDAAIHSLRTGLAQNLVEPHPLLTAGQRVRIRSGSFAGMAGVVMRRKSGLRVILTFEEIWQSVAVEVDEADVEAA